LPPGSRTNQSALGSIISNCAIPRAGDRPHGGHSRRAYPAGARFALDTLSFLSDISVMTETTEYTGQLPPPIERFVLHWGDMGSHWGVNRSVAQIHALLYLADRPLTADEIAGTLGMARSNVSNSIKELQAWNLIRRVPVRNDRRDHFEAETD